LFLVSLIVQALQFLIHVCTGDNSKVDRIIECGFKVSVTYSLTLVCDDLKLEEEMLLLLGWRIGDVDGVILEAEAFWSEGCWGKCPVLWSMLSCNRSESRIHGGCFSADRDGRRGCLFASSDSREVWDSRKDEGQDIIVLALGYC